MSDHPDLKRTQELFWRLITAPQGVAQGLSSLAGRGEIKKPEISWMIHGDERLNSTGRLDIYASMYFYRLRDCLADDFSKVTAVIGGARFHNLITDYLLVHPSSSWSLRDAGSMLPRYLAEHPLGEEFPFIADLARLEWARIEVFDDTDAEVLSRDEITRIPPAGIQEIKLRAVPALRVMKLDWNIAPLWLALDEAEQGEESTGANSAATGGDQEFEDQPPASILRPGNKDSYLKVWRHDLTLFHSSMNADESACLRAMMGQGATLPLLCEVALGKQAEGRVPANPQERQTLASQRMATLLDLWLREGLVRAV
jgi:hypothetical protein